MAMTGITLLGLNIDLPPGETFGTLRKTIRKLHRFDSLGVLHYLLEKDQKRQCYLRIGS
jgi:hypothetical protein